MTVARCKECILFQGKLNYKTVMEVSNQIHPLSKIGIENRGIEPLQRLETWSEQFFLDLVEDAAGNQMQMLTIKVDAQFLPLLERTFRDEIQPLIKRQIEGILLPVDAILQRADCSMIIFYHHDDSRTSLEGKDIAIGDWIQLAKPLSELKKRNQFGFYFAPDALEVSGAEIRLRFIGLLALLRHMGICKTEYLSPDLSKTTEVAKLQDDIWGLGNLMRKLSQKLIPDAILSKACALTRKDRYTTWLELIADLETLEKASLSETVAQSPVMASKNTIQVIVKPSHAEAFKPMVQEMNIQCHFLPRPDLSKSHRQIWGFFHTRNHSAPAFLDDDSNLLFVDWNQHRDGESQTPVGAVPLNCSFSSCVRSSIQLLPFMEQMRQHAIASADHGNNTLSKGAKEKKTILEKWKTMPEKEMEFIEEEALKLDYIERRLSGRNKENVVFQLSEHTKKYPWDKIKRLKHEGVGLTVNDSYLDIIQDYHPAEGHITLRDVKLELEEIPEKGELMQDVRMQVSQFKKQVEACTKFTKGDLVNPALTALLATPDLIPTPPRLVIDHDTFEAGIVNQRLKSDATQLETVKEAIHRQPLFLVQGPPGTGKTTVIVEMIQQILKRQPDARILVTSQSNLAVDNVLERLPENILYMRLAASEDKIGDKLKAHSYDTKLNEWVNATRKRSNDWLDLELSGNKDKLKPSCVFTTNSCSCNPRMILYRHFTRSYKSQYGRLTTAKTRSKTQASPRAFAAFSRRRSVQQSCIC
ncbi:MAG: AAA family ATPase [Bacteroidetes bacterium]|nr:AAA family ATPase [Bacteroidota bacterium]